MIVSDVNFDMESMSPTASRWRFGRREVTSTAWMTWRTNRVNGAAETRMLASIIKKDMMRENSDGFPRCQTMPGASGDAEGA